MSDGERRDEAFDAVQQFTIRPDRRYRVERRDAALLFLTTGSQFDAQWLARGARTILGERIAQWCERSSGTRLLVTGVAVSVLACLMLVWVAVMADESPTLFRGSSLRGIGALFLAFVVGLVMTMAGLSTRCTASRGPRADFHLALSEIAGATLLPPQSELARRGEPQVARVHLQARSGRTIRLGIPTDSDLEAVRTVLPALAA